MCCSHAVQYTVVSFSPQVTVISMGDTSYQQHLDGHDHLNPFKRAQHLATSKNVATKLWPFLNLIQYHPRCMLQHFATGWPNAWNTSCAIMLQDVVCVWPGIWNVFNKDFLTSVYSWRNLNRKLNHLIKLFAKPACAKIFTGGINILNDQAGGQDCRILAEFFFAIL